MMYQSYHTYDVIQDGADKNEKTIYRLPKIRNFVPLISNVIIVMLQIAIQFHNRKTPDKNLKKVNTSAPSETRGLTNNKGLLQT